ncbi:MAG: S4 domain-containing protein [Gemmatimonadales bacterium]|jgi:ribosome-associated heat shock protein Hsp15
MEPEKRGGGTAPPEPVRLDKWLWAARFFKTRGLAAEAIAGGRVEVNGARAKHAKSVRPGDAIRLRLGPYEHLLTVRALSVRRGPASQAALLYEEDPAGKARRLHLAEQHRLAAHAFSYGEGKPTKKERRDLLRFKRGE